MSDADLIEFRVAEPGDSAQLVDLFDGAGGRQAEAPDARRLAETVARVGSDPATALFVGILQRSVVCCAQVSMVPSLDDGGRLHARIAGVRIVSHPMARGFAHALVGFCVEYARDAGAGVVEVAVDRDRAARRAFYAELGFRATHDHMTRPL